MQTVVITGGHSGLGKVASKHLLESGITRLILVGRSIDKMQEAAQEFASIYPRAKIELVSADTASLASVRAASEAIKKFSPLNALICNAGMNALMGKSTYTPEGFEVTFATNYLGHFLLVNELLGSMARDGRIVFTVSGTHDPDTMDGKLVGKAAAAIAAELANDGKPGHGSISAGQRYSTSKLCMVLCAYELHRRLRQQGSSTLSIAYDPGSVPQTGLGRSAPKFLRAVFSSRPVVALMRKIGITTGDLQFSGKSLADLAVRPELAHSSGKYLQSNDLALTERRSSKASYDENVAAKLWADSEKLVQSFFRAN